LKELAGDKFSDNDLNKIKTMSDETYNTVKTMLVQAGVSSLPKSTEQTVSSEAKSTAQTVSSETKLTEASVEEAAEAVADANVNSNEAAVVPITTEKDEKAPAKQLIAHVMGKTKKS
jgi:hypothetical protein